VSTQALNNLRCSPGLRHRRLSSCGSDRRPRRAPSVVDRKPGGGRLRGALRGGSAAPLVLDRPGEGRKEEGEGPTAGRLRRAAPWVIREWIHATRVRRSAATDLTRVGLELLRLAGRRPSPSSKSTSSTGSGRRAQRQGASMVCRRGPVLLRSASDTGKGRRWLSAPTDAPSTPWPALGVMRVDSKAWPLQRASPGEPGDGRRAPALSSSKPSMDRMQPRGWMSWHSRPRSSHENISPSKTSSPWQCGGGKAHRHNGQSIRHGFCPAEPRMMLPTVSTILPTSPRS